MRPTDENQHGSTRPNLMSASRQGGGEDNILAMLDRDAGRGGGSQFSSHPRMAWYVGAGALVVAMVGALGWLAWENANKVPELTVETTLVMPSGGPTVATADSVPADAGVASVQLDPAAQAALPSPAPAPVHDAVVPAVAAAAVVTTDPAVTKSAGAAIIDSPAAPAEAPVMLAQAAPAAAPETAQPSRLPPLVLLPPEEAGLKRKPADAVPAAQPKAAASNPIEADSAPAARPAEKADAQSRPAVRTSRAPRLAVKTDAAASARPAAKGDNAAPPRASAKAPPRRSTKTAVASKKKTPAPATAAVAPAKPQDAADGDVALISAIIMHSSRHAAERANADAAKSCEGGKCPAKPGAR